MTHEEKWNKMYSKALEYYKEYGDLNIPANYVTEKEGIKLGRWISIQRQNYKNGKLKKERIEKLEQIDMLWSALEITRESYEIKWNEMYAQVLNYLEANNNINIPINYQTEDGIKLGQWIRIQRTFYKNHWLSKERIEKLDQIGMKWEAFHNIGKMRKHNDDQWNRKYSLAKKYYEEHGDLNIPINYVTEKEGIKLGSWISNQRTNYKKHALSKEKIEKLEQIGMLWTNLENNYKFYKSKWNEMYALVLEYLEQNNNIDIPINYETKEGVKLGTWISNQRQAYKNNKLSEERIEKLDSIGMKWKAANKRGFQPNEDKWNEMYALAKRYFEAHGNLNIPYNYKTEKEGIKLGLWISKQRVNYKNNKLSKDRIEALKKIGMIWSFRSSKNAKDNIENICIKYNINYDANKDVLEHISLNELLAKIHYLSINNMPIMVNGCLNEIFRMSNINLKIVYGCSLEEMIQEYLDSEAKVKEQTILKKLL